MGTVVLALRPACWAGHLGGSRGVVNRLLCQQLQCPFVHWPLISLTWLSPFLTCPFTPSFVPSSSHRP